MSEVLSDLYALQTLPELLAWRVQHTPQTAAYRHFDTTGQAWVTLDWTQVAQRVAQWSAALQAMDLPQGARVSILLPNGLDAVSIDLATLVQGGRPCPCTPSTIRPALPTSCRTVPCRCWWCRA